MVIEVKHNGYTFYYYPSWDAEQVISMLDDLFGYPEVDCPEPD